MEEAAGTTTMTGEAMMGEAVEVGAAEGSILMIGTKVCFVVPMLSPTCHATAGSLTPTVPTISPSDSPPYFTALTLFDTGAYTSFVNREVSKGLEQRREVN